VTSRAEPSARFRELQRVYADIHVGGLSQSSEDEGAALFAGNSLLPFVDDIRAMIEATGARTVLDYGCGKATIHKQEALTLPDGRRVGRLRDYWRIDGVTLYDPGVAAYAQLPQGRFDGVISTDVLEHIPEEDIPWVLREFFDYADRFVFANIAAYPATKTLPNGWNAHVTIKPAAWWRQQVGQAAQGWRGQAYCFVVSEKRSGAGRLLAKLGGADRMKRTEIRG
jgi:hypothetical protein